MMKNRVYCIYHTKNCDTSGVADLLFQQTLCRRYAEEKGRNIYKEFYQSNPPEKGDDAIIVLSSPTALHKFDTLLVYGLQYLGRKPLHSPFVGEFFEKHGIQVYSVSDGLLQFADFTNCPLRKLAC